MQKWVWDENNPQEGRKFCRALIPEELKQKYEGGSAILFHQAQWDIKPAHKKLIIAAPYLLEALEAMVNHYTSPDENGVVFNTFCAAMARHAISKARGKNV